MGVYHITYTPELRQVCLYMDGGCSFSCHGCITDSHPQDYHIKDAKKEKNRTLKIQEVISFLKPLDFKKVIFLGKEPTEDVDFLPLVRFLKERFLSFNILLTNGYRFVEEEVIDEVCVSIKAISKKLFKDFTGKEEPERALRNFKRYVDRPKVKVRAESIFIPGYIESKEIEKIAQFIANISPEIPYRIDGYVPYSSKDKFRRPTKNQMEKAKRRSERYLKNVSILHSKMKVRYKVERVY
ncbi:MAG: hypothetical protein DRP80_01385 [Candidatus Omnitrophota bacterium]|nr:MAG: hypothetical protein DRP69_03045 [Candidatus Omnitrophota bacterium]RKY44713.1 MAG: hypothetical protein DRP80_01385 [Candidatus Omnitrophota bacterium]